MRTTLVYFKRRKCDGRMKFHEMKEKEVEQSLNTDFSAGLTEDDVKKRRKEFGYNELAEGEKQSALLLFLVNLKILWCWYF